MASPKKSFVARSSECPLCRNRHTCNGRTIINAMHEPLNPYPSSSKYTNNTWSQVAQNLRPLYPKVAHNPLKVEYVNIPCFGLCGASVDLYTRTWYHSEHIRPTYYTLILKGDGFSFPSEVSLPDLKISEGDSGTFIMDPSTHV